MLASILTELETLDRQRDRRDRALAAAVAAGLVDPADAWPEFFAAPAADETAVPSVDADMSGFTWEQTSQDSFAADMDAVMAANQMVSIPDAPATSRSPMTEDLEWT